jgi:hypothetical protein
MVLCCGGVAECCIVMAGSTMGVPMSSGYGGFHVLAAIVSS